MKTRKEWIREGIFAVSTLILVFVCNIFIHKLYDTRALTPMLFVLGVFLISAWTSGYFWGITSSLISVLLVNYAFTFPYYAVDLIRPENVFAAIVMLIVAVVTGTLTTQIKLQEKIKSETEKERMRGNLLRAISHDLRTPLTTIYGSSSTIIDNYDFLSREQKLKLLNEINQDSRWLIRMVENLLLVTRMDNEKDKVQIAKTSIAVEELIDTVLVKFQKRCPGQEVIIHLPEEFLMVPMDGMLIEQVLLNLLENAVYHATGMKELHLCIIKNENMVTFMVFDDGCGIEKEKMTNLFSGYLMEKGLPADGKRSNMGIGLSVCSAIVKAHDSQLHVRNRNPGAEFYFSLEMEKEDE